MDNPQNYFEAYGVRFIRSVCGYCGLPCVYLGEAIRIDLAEGGFQILHVCLPCRRQLCLDLPRLSDAEAHGRHLEEVRGRRERRRAA
jgi:hypothetical protein